MPVSPRSTLLLAGLLAAACSTNTTTGNPVTLPPPANLTYTLDPSGTPGTPAGILLRWDDVTSSSLASYRVYSRSDTTGSFFLRAETTSNTFHDNGVPSVQYLVTSVDVNGGESAGSNVITVDERLELEAPATMVSISLDSAIFLNWADNAFQADPARFEWYRVYSTGFDPAANLCDTTWVLEGTTVSHEFLAAQLANGTPRCYATSAISVEGYESLWSPLIEDTPRPDARNVLVWAFQANAGQSGFRFWNDVNGNGYGDPGELGQVLTGTTPGIDFRFEVNPGDSTLWLVPEFAGDSMRLYQNTPIADLTSIDIAPDTGYRRDSLEAQVGMGYVFRRWSSATAFNYAGLRVTALTHQYAIFDWSVQTDSLDPNLAPIPGPVFTGTRVAASRVLR